MKGRFTKEKPSVYDYVAEEVTPDILKFGEFKIRYYAIYPDSEDLERIKKYILKITKEKGKDKDLSATFCIDSKTNLPKINVVGKDKEEIFVKTFDNLEGFKEFVSS